jgi:MFS transporter, PAT family, beta-lactamase induction signal transducer AmpG
MITLSTHRRWRTTTLFALYAAQGAPEGLLYIALPAWLAANGRSAAEVGTYLAIILLPWSFKIFNGVLMDRFTLLAMGRRRPWILASQVLLVIFLLVLSSGSFSDPSLSFLIGVGFAINLAAAFQDVAIDGMAIDLIPVNERGEANGVMWGGKTLGLAASSAASGAIIAWSGPAAAGLAIALFVAVVMCFPLVLRERPRERLLPWSQGEAAQAKPREADRLFEIVKTLVWASMKPAPILLGAGIVTAFAAFGLKAALAPVFAVQVLDWPQETFGYLAGVASLAGGIFGMVASGYLADRLGSLQTIVTSLVLMSVLHGGMAYAVSYGPAPGLFAVYYFLHAVVFVQLSVSVYSRAMALSHPAIAATHFAAFMALLNLGSAWGAQWFGWIESSWGYAGVLYSAAAYCLLALALFAGSGRVTYRG